MSFNTLSTLQSNLFRNGGIQLTQPTITVTTPVQSDATKVRLTFTHDKLGIDGAMYYDFTAVPTSGSTITGSATASPYVLTGLTGAMNYTITCKARKGGSRSKASSSSSYYTYSWDTSTTSRDCSTGHCLASPGLSLGVSWTFGNVITVHWVQNIINTALSNNFLTINGNGNLARLTQFTNTYTQIKCQGVVGFNSVVTTGIIPAQVQTFDVIYNNASSPPSMTIYIDGVGRGSIASTDVFDMRTWVLTSFSFSGSGIDMYSYAFFQRALSGAEITALSSYQLTNSIYDLDPALSKTSLVKNCIFNTTNVKQISNSDGSNTTNYYCRNFV